MHHLSLSPRTWPLQQPVADNLKAMAVLFVIAGIVLDQRFGLAVAEQQQKAEAAAKEAAAGGQGDGCGSWVKGGG